jgi:hypothetical protein
VDAKKIEDLRKEVSLKSLLRRVAAEHMVSRVSRSGDSERRSVSSMSFLFII